MTFAALTDFEKDDCFTRVLNKVEKKAMDDFLAKIG